jgi:nitrate/nitrite transport system substrate-binding protein
MAEVGIRPPDGAYRKFRVMGREFDPAKPDEYLKGFPLHRMG